ncbi:hypothetical protein [Streptomyces sp. NPDC093261]|uniref:hypothetical protein n=1 Tax=Streptomyces sp. NPDC093261 TaxID=3366037 RepID=UPI003822409C
MGIEVVVRRNPEGKGKGFASFAVVRIDQILLRGVDPHRSWVLSADGRDHLPAAAGISW